MIFDFGKQGGADRGGQGMGQGKAWARTGTRTILAMAFPSPPEGLPTLPRRTGSYGCHLYWRQVPSRPRLRLVGVGVRAKEGVPLSG